MTTPLFPVELPVLMNAANISFDKGASFLSTNGQLWIGSSTGNPAPATISVSNGITITNGANSIGLSFDSAGSMDPYFVVDNTNTPYVVNTATNYYLGCDTSAVAITVKLPDTPTNGDSFVVKDYLGNAAVHNITITTVSGITLIDGAASYVMSTNYQSVQIFGGSGKWQIF